MAAIVYRSSAKLKKTASIRFKNFTRIVIYIFYQLIISQNNRYFLWDTLVRVSKIQFIYICFNVFPFLIGKQAEKGEKGKMGKKGKSLNNSQKEIYGL